MTEQMQPMYQICDGGFGCNCPEKRADLIRSINNMHGTRAKYQRGCRCLACKDANNLYFRQRRRK